MPIDAVDLEVVKASLSGIVQEMQNSLFRTGFSTIVRESQDASCALMNAERRGGGAARGAAAAHRRVPGLLRRRARRIQGRHRGGRRVPDQRPLRRRQPACAGHRGDHAGDARRQAARLLRQHRPQERHRRAGAGQLLGPGARGVQRGPAASRGALPARRPAEPRPRAHHRGEQPHARAGARRHPRPARRRPPRRAAARRADRQARRGQDPRLLRPAVRRVRAQGAHRGRRMAGRPLRGRALHRRRRHRAQQAGARACGGGEARRRDPFRLFAVGRPDARARPTSARRWCAPRSAIA